LITSSRMTKAVCLGKFNLLGSYYFLYKISPEEKPIPRESELLSGMCPCIFELADLRDQGQSIQRLNFPK
jgi:hypothetical protein